MKVNDKPIQSNPNESVLVCLERHGIKLDSCCREGICGDCKKQCTGKPEYMSEPLGYLQEGEVLTCIARASSNINLEIKV
ncbi:2Fe-2S iron-sulfur cluster-binding protein [Vibrio maritimus]|jgi:ferredoxin|uniref:2Fe-2S iron-sulfur cluster-binding protein n=1 Tax=Vibrio chaetopteri TaxID=3016528 RepID=A0AAU8BUL3_9VIBR